MIEVQYIAFIRHSILVKEAKSGNFYKVRLRYVPKGVTVGHYFWVDEYNLQRL